MIRSEHTSHLYTWAALTLAFTSLLLSTLVSRAVFERLPHLEDELAYLFQARVFASGAVVAERPTPHTPYWQPFVIDHSSGTRFGKYPPGWPALLAVGVGLGAAWLVNGVFAMLTVALVYRLGAEIFDRTTGLIAALLTTVSPMALLLSGTLMGHTSALFFTTLFMYAYWRLSRPAAGRRLAWGLIAGLALGMVAINRPLTAVAVALPFVIYSGLRLLIALRGSLVCVWPLLRPLLLLSGAALAVSTAIPLFNLAAVGSATTNLYTLVWPYDRIGFGPAGEYGPNGHTLLKGVQFARYDLSLTAADLFGWQLALFEPETDAQRGELLDAATCNSDAPRRLQAHLRSCAGYWPALGLSWLLLPLGLLAGLRGRWAWVWLAAGVAWLAVVESVIQVSAAGGGLVEAWVLYGLFWALAPLAFIAPRFARVPAWTWLLFGVLVALIFAHFAYWVGSQRYSTRYYAEGLTAAALLSALALGWLLGRLRALRWRALVIGGLLAACLWSLVMYSVPRLSALHGFNRVSQAYVEAILARAESPDTPLLVLATGAPPVRWRATGALMALTSPALDSPVVVAWDSGVNPDVRAAILARFPDRQVIEIGVHEEDAWFLDACPPAARPPVCPVINP